MPSLYFESSTNIKDLIGRRLVTNKISAIFELVKNSFDADADNVWVEFGEDGDTLVIRDDGDGMSLEDIKNKWMVIGTNNKRGIEVSPKGRPLNGEKGIGRFSVDRLGRSLTLISSTGLSSQSIKLSVDWENFEDRDGKKLSEIPIDYTFLSNKREKGVELIIRGLRDVWTEKEVKNLEKRLRGLLNPFTDLDEYVFSITLSCEKYGYFKKKLEPYSLSEISSLWIQMEIPKNKTDIIKYCIYRNGAEVETNEYPNPYSFGPVKINLYSFDAGDKKSFFSKFGEYVFDFGNVRIYRDCFQIYPYGEPGNDWLDLSIHKSEGFFRRLGIRDLVGYIQISRVFNKSLIEATNRQGLEENIALHQLRQFVIEEALRYLENYFFITKNKTEEKEHIQHREDITKATKSLLSIAKEIKHSNPEQARQVSDLSALIREKSKQQDRIIRGQQQMVEVYKRLSSKGTLMQSIIHQVLIKLQLLGATVFNLKEDISKCQLPNDMRKSIEDTHNSIITITDVITQSLLSARDYLLRKREKITLNLHSQLEQVFKEHKHELDANNIHYFINGSANINFKFDLNDFKTVFENLLSNSVKSLKKVSDQNRKIEVNYSVDGLRLNVFFKDSGIGIDKNIANKIFAPFYTTTDNGFGMGLSIVDEVMKLNKAEIDLIIPKDGEKGATFQLTFNLGE